jgi:hypothetical protein
VACKLGCTVDAKVECIVVAKVGSIGMHCGAEVK